MISLIIQRIGQRDYMNPMRRQVIIQQPTASI